MIKGTSTASPNDRVATRTDLFERPSVGRQTAAFFSAAGHEEALARLLYLAEYGRAGGLVVGPSGVGKSRVLQEASQELRASRRHVVELDLHSLDGDGVIDRAMRASGLVPSIADSAAAYEGLLRSYWQGQQLVGKPVVVVVDNLDRCELGAYRTLDRLLHLVDSSVTRLTVLAAAEDAVASQQLDWLSRNAELRVDLPPFTAEEVARYLKESVDLAEIGITFGEDAVSFIRDSSEGNPRVIQRLARLAVLAADAENRPVIDADLMTIIATEMPTLTRRSRLSPS